MSHPTARPVGRAATTWSRLAVILALLATTLLSAVPTQADAASMKSPSGLKAADRTTTSLTVTWKAVSEAENYRVQYSTSSKMKKAKYERSTDISSTLTGLKRSTTYYVKVRVIDADGDNLSSYSKAVKVKTPSKDPVPSGGTPTPTPSPTQSPSPT
ncbi:MAG: fibronectin type III domain-containing protein, partial [Janthinobacterium lividum]